MRGLHLGSDDDDVNVASKPAIANQGLSFMDSALGNLGEPLTVEGDDDEDENEDENNFTRTETRGSLAEINSA